MGRFFVGLLVGIFFSDFGGGEVWLVRLFLVVVFCWFIFLFVLVCCLFVFGGFFVGLLLFFNA